MSEELQLIERSFEDFKKGIENCLAASPSDSATIQDAYNRLARLRERYMKEKKKLRPFERDALAKVFENDPFIKGMMDTRQIGEHIEQRDGVTIRTPGNAPIHLSCESSAAAVFRSHIVVLPTTDGKPRRLNHLVQLEEAAKRIAKALSAARREA